MNHPLISIIITAYNVEDKIERALDSAISQTYDNTEIIVVEDCSTDNTFTVIEGYIKEHLGINVIRHLENKGSGAAHRTGHENARGEYVMFLDGDDWIDKDFIESLYNESEDGAIDIVSGGITIHYANGDITVLTYHNHTEIDIEKITNHFCVHNVYLINRLIKKNFQTNTRIALDV